jgi:hypothetical protein
MMMRIMTKTTIMKRTNKMKEGDGMEIQPDIKMKETKEAAIGILAGDITMTKTTMNMTSMMMKTTMKMITEDAEAVSTVNQVVVHAEDLVE